MGKWREMSMETPRDRLKKRKALEVEKKKKFEDDKVKKLKIRIIGILIAVLVVIGIFMAGIVIKEKKVTQAKLAKAASVKVIPNLGRVDFMRAGEDYFFEDDNETLLMEGDSLRLEDNGKARLDFGNGIAVTLKNSIELKLERIFPVSETQIEADFYFDSGSFIAKIPGGRGDMKINTSMGSIDIISSGLTIFKVEYTDSSTVKVAVNKGQVEVKGKEDISKKLLSEGKYLLIDNSNGYVSAGKMKDLNIIGEAWD
ncbi:MAG: FecR family protein [Candidatus Muirbacterium halophilum]|nr:FecR family protein [Candidatus Muirbacterium halophilum]MCK9474566.1 FecR family protein [Candidatus Muirbacterium halophilum]